MSRQEHVTCVPSKDKIIHTWNWVWLLGISNKCTVSKYGKYSACMNLYFDGTLVYTEVAHSLATFAGSYAPGMINHQYYSSDIIGFPGASRYNIAHPPNLSAGPLLSQISAQPPQCMPPGFQMIGKL